MVGPDSLKSNPLSVAQSLRDLLRLVRSSASRLVSEGLSMGQIAAQLGIGKGSVHRVLAT